MKKKDKENIEELEDKKEECEEEVTENEDNLDTTNIEQLTVDYEKSQTEVEELKNRLLRLHADFENYKKRTQKEKESIVTYASEGLITELLPALDNFDRALQVDVDENSKSLYEGVEMVYNQISEALKNNGLEEIECLNEKFDHNCHHAVVQQESDEHEEDTVIQVLGKGYKYKDKVIRPSMVMVSK